MNNLEKNGFRGDETSRNDRLGPQPDGGTSGNRYDAKDEDRVVSDTAHCTYSRAIRRPFTFDTQWFLLECVS